MHWKAYQELELVPDRIPEPDTINSVVAYQLVKVWGSIVRRKVEKLPPTIQIQHLERCWFRDGMEHASRSSGIWRSLWAALNRPLFAQGVTAISEPEIRQVADHQGQVWWCAYDPRTGRRTYLESEEEVQIWLEQRFY